MKIPPLSPKRSNFSSKILKFPCISLFCMLHSFPKYGYLKKGFSKNLKVNEIWKHCNINTILFGVLLTNVFANLLQYFILYTYFCCFICKGKCVFIFSQSLLLLLSAQTMVIMVQKTTTLPSMEWLCLSKRRTVCISKRLELSVVILKFCDSRKFIGVQ